VDIGGKPKFQSYQPFTGEETTTMAKKHHFLKSVTALTTFGLLLGGTIALSSAAEPDPTTLHKGWQQEWRLIRGALNRELDECRIQCKGDSGCLEKCNREYQSKVNSEFSKLKGDKAAVPVDDINAVPACPFCGMDRQKFAHSRVFIQYDDGSVMGGCSIHCAAADMAVNLDKAPLSIWVGDYNHKNLSNAESSTWVLGGKKTGVMTKRAKWAFEKKEDADRFIQSEGGEIVTFEKAIRAAYEDMYEDNKLIRERRKAKRMMQQHAGH